jgi:hypothetical protein
MKKKLKKKKQSPVLNSPSTQRNSLLSTMTVTRPNYQYYGIQFFEDLVKLVVQHLTNFFFKFLYQIKWPIFKISLSIYCKRTLKGLHLESVDTALCYGMHTSTKKAKAGKIRICGKIIDRHKYNLYKDIRQKRRN